MKDLASLHFRTAVLYALAAMLLGNVMGASHDFSLRTAHAHMNLLGWVSIALYGVYLRLHPEMAATKLARAHFWLAQVGALVMIGGLWAIGLTNEERGVPAAAAGGTISLIAMVVFAVMVYRTPPRIPHAVA